MPTLTISEFSDNISNNNMRQVASLPALAHTIVTIGAASAQSVMFQPGTTLIRVATDTACRIFTAANPTALATSLPLAAGQSEYFGVPVSSGFRIAVIAA